MIKRIALCLLAAALAAVSLSACSAAQEEEGSTQPATQVETEIAQDTSSFKLSYSKPDSLNPFESETLNNQIVQNLVFDSLFVLDEAYEAQPSIASGYSYTDSTTLEVTIMSGIEFSTGEKLDATDVVNSFTKAKESPRWKNSLKYITSASEVSDTVIRFKLRWANPYAHNLLTFAIASSNTDDNGYPVGSGRYKFGEGDGEVYLEVNEKHKDFAPHITRIPLINITSSESVENAVNIGNISYAFRDMSENTKAKIQCNKKAVNMNNLVYIGVNCTAGITADPNIRKAISLAVDRDTIVKSAYRGYARSALSVFNPASALGKDTQLFTATADVAAAKQAISQSSYASALKLEILTSNNESKVAAAQLLKQQLEAAGFTVTIDKEGSANYEKKVFSNAFNIYIGEVKLPGDMSLESFYTRNGWTAAGIDFANSKTYSSYWGWLDGSNELGKFVLDFSEEMPFIPLLYRQGMLCYSKSMHGDMQGYEGNYFSNIEDWYFN